MWSIVEESRIGLRRYHLMKAHQGPIIPKNSFHLTLVPNFWEEDAISKLGTYQFVEFLVRNKKDILHEFCQFNLFGD